MALTQPPPQLAVAIHSASQQYGVPEDILTGVWRIESASSFPDTAHNAQGYGGLFGTKDYVDTPQGQANYAASVLANLKSQYGNWATALYHYSGGAYTSVPGQTTGGGTFITKSGPVQTTTPVSTAGTSSGGSILDIGGSLSNIANVITGIPQALQNDLPRFGIGIGFGLLAVLLIIGGVLVIAFPAVKTVAQATPVGAITRGK